MTSITRQCPPLLQVGRGREGGCSFGGAASTPKCNLHARANMAVNFHQTGSGGGFEKAFLSGGVLQRSLERSLSTSASFSGLGNSLRHRGSEDHRCSRGGCRISAHALSVPEIEKLPANVEMLESYEIEEKVRDYELDHYGVVNNAIYAQFCQHARTELLENIGFSPDAVTQTGRAMAISDMSMKFLSPLRSGDRYIVSSRVAGTTAVRLIFEDHIYRLPERDVRLVMSAKSTVVVLDKNSKPGRLPEEIKAKLVTCYLTNYRVNGSSASGYVINGTGNSRIGHVSGKSASGHCNGNSRTGKVDDNSTNVLVDGISTNDDLVNAFVKYRSASKVPALVA